MTTQATSRRRRRLPRMRVATLLVLVAAVGGPAGWYIHGARSQRLAVQALRDADAVVTYDWEWEPGRALFGGNGKQLSGWRRFLADRFGPDAVATVAAVSLQRVAGEDGSGAADEHIALVGRFRSLRELGLGTFTITEAGAATIAGLKQLEYIEIHDLLRKSAPGPILSRLGEDSPLKRLLLTRAVLVGEDFAAISRLSRLQTLLITENAAIIGDADLARLTGLGQLKSLMLSHTEITSEGLKSIGHMKLIEHIALDESSIDDLAPFLQFPMLKTLGLGDCRAGDGSISALGDMPALKSLSLGSNSLTDAGLARLRISPALQSLMLRSDSITAAGLKSIAIPQKINHIVINKSKSKITPEEAAEFNQAHPNNILHLEKWSNTYVIY